MKVLVYCFVNKGNAGDQFFVEAFEYLFPTVEFTFTDHITARHLIDVDAVFIGGGSFLFAAPDITPDALALMAQKRLFYIGIGGETEIHPIHQELLSKAKYVACRTPNIDKLKAINPETYFLPDLVYALRPFASIFNPKKKVKSVLILPNISAVPNYTCSYWEHAAWNYFKSEFAQFLDWLVDAGYSIKFLPMCQSDDTNDTLAISEIIAHMKNRSQSYTLISETPDFTTTACLFSEFETVITQRFHGIVLAEITKTPYLSIYHHDKLKYTSPNNGAFLSYYNINKQVLIDNFLQINREYTPNLAMDPNIYVEFAKKIISLL